MTRAPLIEQSARGPLANAEPTGRSSTLPQSRIIGSGRALSVGERAFFEPRFGVDFASVRIHHDPGLTDAWAARAMTVGDRIVLGGDPTPAPALLAHELAHVVQQRRGGAAPALAPDAPHEREANTAAERIVAGAGVRIACGTAAGIARDATVGALAAMSPDELEQERDRLLAALGKATPGPDVQARLDAIDREIAGRSATDPEHGGFPARTPFEAQVRGERRAFRPVIDAGADYPRAYERTAAGVRSLYNIDGSVLRASIGETPSEAVDSPIDYFPTRLAARGAVGIGKLTLSGLQRFGRPMVAAARGYLAKWGARKIEEKGLQASTTMAERILMRARLRIGPKTFGAEEVQVAAQRVIDWQHALLKPDAEALDALLLEASKAAAKGPAAAEAAAMAAMRARTAANALARRVEAFAADLAGGGTRMIGEDAGIVLGSATSGVRATLAEAFRAAYRDRLQFAAQRIARIEAEVGALGLTAPAQELAPLTAKQAAVKGRW